MSDPRVTPGSEILSDPKYRTFARMLSGKWYLPDGKEMELVHDNVRRYLPEINALGNQDLTRTRELLSNILADESHIPEWWAPLSIEYGINTVFGKDCFVNSGMTILDCNKVTIGDRVQFGPNCNLITVGHPVDDIEMRAAGWEFALPITIGDDCWFGAGVQVMPGVTIGPRCVVAAGAVVTRDMPADSLIAGVPARRVRPLGDGSRPLERESLDI